MRIRSKDWCEREVLKEFSDAQLRENFRMSRGAFVKPYDLTKDVMGPEEMTARPTVPLEMRVAMAL